QALAKLKPVNTDKIFTSRVRRTPTYTKPMLCQLGQAPRELNRLDIKNRTPTPEPVRDLVQDLVVHALNEIWPQIDAMMVLDQVSEENCGVVTTRVRDELARLGEAHPRKFVLADSRERIRSFRCVSVKPNSTECYQAIYPPGGTGYIVSPTIERAVDALA